MYSENFFRRRQAGAEASATVVVPILAELLRPARVLDVGCGDGSWSRTFTRLGVQTVGVDGPWTPCPDAARFDFARDCPIAASTLPAGPFDLVICLELLEHLTEARGAALLAWFACLSDALIVSAATPGQGGTGHVNEHWPAYWAAKLAEHGYVACDFLRPAIWGDQRVSPWYRQNIIGYFRPSVPDAVIAFATQAWSYALAQPLALAHPDVYRRGNVSRHIAKLGV